MWCEIVSVPRDSHSVVRWHVIETAVRGKLAMVVAAS